MTESISEVTSRIFRTLIIIFVVIIGIWAVFFNILETVVGISIVSGFVLGFAFQQRGIRLFE